MMWKIYNLINSFWWFLVAAFRATVIDIEANEHSYKNYDKGKLNIFLRVYDGKVRRVFYGTIYETTASYMDIEKGKEK